MLSIHRGKRRHCFERFGLVATSVEHICSGDFFNGSALAQITFVEVDVVETIAYGKVEIITLVAQVGE